MSKILLDASALLSVVYGEEGHEIVEKAFGSTAISAVNYAEAISKMVDKDIEAQEAAGALSEIVRVILPFDKDIAILAGELRPETRKLGLSMGDRACLATAINEGFEVLTADKAWAKLKLPIKIRLIR